MQQIAIGNYSIDEIIDMLHAKKYPRVVKFRYELLDKNENRIKDLENIEQAGIKFSALSDIKRTATFKLIDNGEIDFISNRIKPYICFKMPDGNFIEWPQGVFILTSPRRKGQNGNIYREIEAFDGIYILKNYKIDTRYTVAKTTNYKTAITAALSLAGVTKINIENTADTLQTAREWEPGTDLYKIVSDLLSDINFTSIWVDENGYYRAAKYINPKDRSVEYSYLDNEFSVIMPGAEEDQDFFNIPNKFIVVQSNAETTPLIATYTNSNPDSAISTVRRGYAITDFRTIDNIASQTALNEYCQRIATEATQLYTQTTIQTAIMPFHGYMDIIYLKYADLGIDSVYNEISWELQLKAGAQMTHTLRRVIQV